MWGFVSNTDFSVLPLVILSSGLGLARFARMSTSVGKAQFCAVFLAVATLCHLCDAQAGMRVSDQAATALSWTPLELIQRQYLNLVGPPKRVKERFPTWRLSTPVHHDVLVRGGGTQFTVIVEFAPERNTTIKHFVVRVRSLLAEEAAWYTEGHGDQPRRVHAALRLPVVTLTTDQSRPEIVIDVECDACDMKKVSLIYEDERPDFSTVRNRADFLEFFSRERQTTAPKVILQDVDPRGNSDSVCRWEFDAMSSALCTPAFDGRMFLIADALSKEISFFWQLGSATYNASAIQNGPGYLVRWLPKDSLHFCNEQRPQITFIATCVGCNVYERLTRAEIPKEPGVPRGADSVPVAQFRGSWREDGTCGLDGLSWASIGKADDEVLIPRLWLDCSVPCQGHPTETRNASSFGDLQWQAKRAIVSGWQKDLAARYRTGRDGLSFSGGSQCLCDQLRGRLYRLVSWDSHEVALVQRNAQIGNALRGKSRFQLPFEYRELATAPISRKKRHINKASVVETRHEDPTTNEDGVNSAPLLSFSAEKKDADSSSKGETHKKENGEDSVTLGNPEWKAEVDVPLPITANEDDTKSEVYFVALKQRIVLHREENTDMQFLTGIVDISAPEIQCAKSSVVVMFVVDAEDDDWDLAFLSSSIGRLGAYYVYRKEHALEVSIKPQSFSQQHPCVVRPDATLTLKLNGASYTNLTSAVTFSFGRPFKEVQPQVITATAFVNKTSTRPRELMMWRFSTAVPPEVLARGAGTPFTVVFKFLPDTSGRTTYFVARPQTLLDEAGAWYTERLSNGGNKVYIALRLPLMTGQNETHEKLTSTRLLPMIVIDIACAGCDPQKASVAYGPAYPEWLSIKKRKVFQTVSQRCPTTGPLTAFQRMPDSMCRPSARCFTFNTTVNSVCGNLFKGGLLFAVFPPASKTDFYWQLMDDTRVRYKSNVGVEGSGRLVLLGSEDDNGNICKEKRNSKISLYMTCKWCNMRRFYGLVHPTLPEVPLGNSSGLVLPYIKLAKPSWDESGTCQVNTSNNGTASFGDIPRLWLSFEVPCSLQLKRTNGTPSTPEELLSEWETQIINDLAARKSWSFAGVSQCFCEALRGHFYRAVPWEKTATLQPSDYITDIATQYDRDYNETQGKQESCATVGDMYENRGYDDDDRDYDDDDRDYDDGDRDYDDDDRDYDDDDRDYDDDDRDYDDDDRDYDDNDGSDENSVDDNEDDYYYTSEERPSKKVFSTAVGNFEKATDQFKKLKQLIDVDKQTTLNGEKLLVNATILNTNVSQTISLLLEMTPNSVKGKQDGDRMVFEYWMTKKEMKSTVPFVVTLCFVCSSNDASTVEFVLSEEKVKVLKARTPIESPVHCYTINACETWDMLSHPNEATMSVVPQITVAGNCHPEELRWGMDIALELKDTLLKKNRTSVSRAGWYGTAEERSKYRSSNDIVEIKVQNSSAPFCVPVTTANELLNGGGDDREDTGNVFQPLAFSAGEPSFIYLQPPFEVHPTKTLLYSGSRRRFMAIAIILALTFTTFKLHYYDMGF